MSTSIENLLSPRIVKHCMSRFNDHYYIDAAREAMIQVELAIKEKNLVKDGRYGVNLIRSVFDTTGKNKNVKMRIPFGDELQKQAGNYFESVFSYYRNYVMHNSSNVDERVCTRILIIASELLEMINASSLSYSDLGGVEGLLNAGVFENKNQILQLLLKLHENYFPDGNIEGFIEEIFEEFGMGYEHIYAAIDLDLIQYNEKEYIPDKEEKEGAWQNWNSPETLGWFELTDLGNTFINEIQKDTKVT